MIIEDAKIAGSIMKTKEDFNMNTVKLLEAVQTMAVKAKPFVIPVLGAVVTTTVKVLAGQKEEARLLGLEQRIKELEILKK